jgi:lipoate-protein ligase A
MALNLRLILDVPADGASNMARDEAISRAVASGAQPPTLRFYGWQPPCISLGQAQRIRSVDLEAIAADGVGVVRRATGGLAILHTDEFTYSLSLPVGHPLAEGDLMTSYRRIAGAIVDGLRRLGVSGVNADRVAKEDRAKGPVCFEAPSDYEVVGGATGKKLVGSAQWRRVDGILQHGSLPLRGDIARICRYLVGAPPPDQVRAHAGTLAEVIGREAGWDEVAAAWRAAFAETLGIAFEAAALSEQEAAAERELRASRYADDAWTRRR